MTHELSILHGVSEMREEFTADEIKFLKCIHSPLPKGNKVRGGMRMRVKSLLQFNNKKIF
jgi:hypothetical protein